MKFFEYYSYIFDNNTKTSINKDLKESLNENSSKLAFSIEDPFEPKHNPGRSMKINSRQYMKFSYSMKKEINNILSGQYIKRLYNTFF